MCIFLFLFLAARHEQTLTDLCIYCIYLLQLLVDVTDDVFTRLQLFVSSSSFSCVLHLFLCLSSSSSLSVSSCFSFSVSVSTLVNGYRAALVNAIILASLLTMSMFISLPRKRLKEGFTFAYNKSGIINMVIEVDIQVPDEAIILPCVIQYVIFPPRLVNSNEAM